MKYLYSIFICLLVFSCKPDTSNNTKATPASRTIQTLTIDEKDALLDELKTRFDNDQKALSDFIHASHADAEKKEIIKKKVVAENTVRMKALFEKYGFLGWDMFGEEGSHHFWLMVLHADDDTDFQYAVLKDMQKAVENNNAFPPNYVYLTDRVRLNTNKKQIYGTQVKYTDKGQAIPEPLIDSLNVNERRANIAMKPIELYLNKMTKKHYDTNKAVYLKRGVKGPILLDVAEN